MRYLPFGLVIVLAVFQVVVVVVVAAATTEEESPLYNEPKENSNTTTTASPFYTCFDDASWAIVSPHLSSKLSPDKQRVYDEFMAGCERNSDAKANCQGAETNRLEMNAHQPAAMRNFTRHGFLKRRAPPGVMALLQDYFAKHQHSATVEWSIPTPYHNNWISPPTIARIDNTSLHGGGPQLASRIGREVQEIMKEWTGQRLSVTSVFGIRIYHNQSILTPHVDRLPLVSSAIINVAQDVDEDWPLEVYDHDGVAHNVTMQPGDMILYESHSVIHGRPFPLNGRYFANAFVHFEPLGSLRQDNQQQQHEEDAGTLSQQQQQQEYEALAFSSGLPHYIIPGTVWAQKWWDQNPRGWSLFTDIEALIKRGDLDTLRYIHQHHPQLLKASLATHTGWQPIHEAIRDGHVDIVQFLIETVGADVNADCYIPHHMTPLALARFYHGTQHDMSLFLEKHGAVEPAISAKVREIHEARKLQKVQRQREEEEQQHNNQNSQQQQQQQNHNNNYHQDKEPQAQHQQEQQYASSPSRNPILDEEDDHHQGSINRDYADEQEQVDNEMDNIRGGGTTTTHNQQDDDRTKHSIHPSDDNDNVEALHRLEAVTAEAARTTSSSGPPGEL